MVICHEVALCSCEVKDMLARIFDTLTTLVMFHVLLAVIKALYKRIRLAAGAFFRKMTENEVQSSENAENLANKPLVPSIQRFQSAAY